MSRVQIPQWSPRSQAEGTLGYSNPDVPTTELWLKFSYRSEAEGALGHSNPLGSTEFMNVLFLCRLFFPHIGGVEKHVLEISKNLIKEGHRIVVVTERYKKDLKLHEKVEGIEIYRVPNLKENWFKKFQIWKWMWKNRSLIVKSDIIHCHDVFFWHLPFRFLFS